MTLSEVSVDELEGLIKNGATVIDIRRPDEWKKTGLIESAFPIESFTEQKEIHPEFFEKFSAAVPSKDQPFIIYCHAALRSEKLGYILTEELGFTEASHLSGGIAAWIDSGHMTTPYQD